MVVKTKTADNLITDLKETFTNLKRYRWKLNPLKCIFGVPSGILLGYIVSARGIEPNPDKVSATVRTEDVDRAKEERLITCICTTKT